MGERYSLCFSTLSTMPLCGTGTSVFRFRKVSSLSFSKFSYSRPPCFRLLRFGVRASDDYPGDDSLGSFPWESSSSDGDGVQWVREDKITLFTSDGLIQLGGTTVPRHASPLDNQGKSKTSKRFQRFKESDYMDPSQSLCLGALFDIAATNGQDMGRRLCIFGFCRSVEMLSDVVEDTVVEHGGEVVAAEKASKGGLHEKLSMKVAVPFLWGIPPASETLRLAVRSGGGIVDKVFWQWDFA